MCMCLTLNVDEVLLREEVEHHLQEMVMQCLVLEVNCKHAVFWLVLLWSVGGWLCQLRIRVLHIIGCSGSLNL